MEACDKNLILKFIKTDQTLKRLYLEHSELEDQLEGYRSQSYLTSEEEMEEKRLKKQKLFGVDRMMMILASHRRETGSRDTESHAY